MPVLSLSSDATPAVGRSAALRQRIAPRALLQPLAIGIAAGALLAAPLLLGRQALVHHQAERQAQVVQALTLGLQALPGDLATRLRVLPSATGGLATEVHVLNDQGQALAQWRLWRLPVLAPDVFVSLLALPESPARAQTQVDGQPVGLQVRAGVADLIDVLWQVMAATAAALGGSVALTLTWAWKRERWLIEQAEADTAALLQRQQRLFDAQAEQLEQLRQRAHRDELTGLPNRRHFIALLDDHLAQPGTGLDAGLLLVRLHDLSGTNQRIGHANADRVLQTLAHTLEAYPQRISRCAAGRLNGADFALLLPAPGLAAETAESLQTALRLALGRIDAQARVAIGGVELAGHDGRLAATQALALADAALAQAEVQGGVAVQAASASPVTGSPIGEAGWQRRIARALAHGRAALAEYPMVTPDGRRLLLDCPLRVKLSADGPYEPAQRWLALAVRSRLSAEVDEKALALALAAIARDGQARCVNMSSQSLASPEFVAGVTRRLQAAPDAACRLWIDIPEGLALERPMLVRELSRHWRPLGALLALEHAGECLLRIPRLIDLGLDCVRIDGRFVNGIADPAAEAARRYLAGLVRLVQSVGLQVTAEGVRSPEDLEALWALGFDAATGPALAPPSPADSGEGIAEFIAEPVGEDEAVAA